MKIIILKELIRVGLSIVGRVGFKNLSLPILGNVLLSGEKNFLCLKATDLEIGIKRWCLAKIEKEGQVACPLRIFQSAIDSLSAEKIILRTEEKNLLIEAENFQASLKSFDSEEFPIIPEPEIKEKLAVNAQDFISGLGRVVDFTATSTIKPEITGVYFRFLDNQLKMVSTDSFRLAEKTVSLAAGAAAAKEISFILPQRSCRELVDIFGDRPGDLHLYLGSNQALIEAKMPEIDHPEIHFLSRLIEGDYPNYQEIVPSDFKAEAEVFRADFLQALKSEGLFANKINEIKIFLDVKKQQILIRAQNQEVGESNLCLPAKIKGQADELSFNWRFLAEGVSQIKEKEFVFSVSKEDGPALLKGKTANDYFYLVMPLRV